LEHAIVLLSNTDKQIDQIAYECGFKSTSYFSYSFKKEFLVSPLKYRMQMKG
ncbi:MAG: helix-turn-helix transcriptional regulator, partial [Lachnospira sp.]|nr:helix-turn-helix transcriptional regulator [Lachnospira sp.]